jgi:hypothetical protein
MCAQTLELQSRAAAGLAPLPPAHFHTCTRPLLVAAASTGAAPCKNVARQGMAVIKSDTSCATRPLPPVATENTSSPRFMLPITAPSPAGVQTARKGSTHLPTRCHHQTRAQGVGAVNALRKNGSKDGRRQPVSHPPTTAQAQLPPPPPPASAFTCHRNHAQTWAQSQSTNVLRRAYPHTHTPHHANTHTNGHIRPAPTHHPPSSGVIVGDGHHSAHVLVGVRHPNGVVKGGRQDKAGPGGAEVRGLAPRAVGRHSHVLGLARGCRRG